MYFYKEWGLEFTIEFDITVTKVPAIRRNIFHFTIGGNDAQYGDCIPAIFLKAKDRKIEIVSAVNGNQNHTLSVDYNRKQKHHVVIKQFKEEQRHIYEVAIDGKTVHRIPNEQARNFSNVKLYASDPWNKSLAGPGRGGIAQVENLEAVSGIEFIRTYSIL